MSALFFQELPALDLCGFQPLFALKPLLNQRLQFIAGDKALRLAQRAADKPE